MALMRPSCSSTIQTCSGASIRWVPESSSNSRQWSCASYVMPHRNARPAARAGPVSSLASLLLSRLGGRVPRPVRSSTVARAELSSRGAEQRGILFASPETRGRVPILRGRSLAPLGMTDDSSLWYQVPPGHGSSARNDSTAPTGAPAPPPAGTCPAPGRRCIWGAPRCRYAFRRAPATH